MKQLLALLLIAFVTRSSHGDEKAAAWLDQQEKASLQKIFENTSRPDTAPGSVIASPTLIDPNYFFYWVRDGALVMEAILDQAVHNANPELRATARQRLYEFADFSRRNQLTPTLTGIGEPKFRANGDAFNEEWGRPQNDGPALRAIVLSKWAELLLAQGQEDYVRSRLYDGRAPSNSVIKVDLDFVKDHWAQPSVDLWEEINEHHFYTRMVQYKALRSGAALATRLGDRESAKKYEDSAQLLAKALEDHAKNNDGILRPSFPQDPQKPQTAKPEKLVSQYDLAVTLALLHGEAPGTFDIAHPRALTSMRKLRDAFVTNIIPNAQGRPGDPMPSAYPINQDPAIPGIAIGRYPGDLYNGSTNNNGANPWILATLAFAQAHYKIATIYLRRAAVPVDNATLEYFRSLHTGRLKNVDFREGETLLPKDPRFRKVVNALLEEGDSYVLRVRYHSLAHGNASLSEQFSRFDGHMCSAADLTWSHASVLSAVKARRELISLY